MIFVLREKFVDKVIKTDLFKDAENVDFLALCFSERFCWQEKQSLVVSARWQKTRKRLSIDIDRLNAITDVVEF